MNQLPKPQKGYGVVGTWFAPKNKIGGAIPVWLDDSKKSALQNAHTNNLRLFKFKGKTRAYLCEITITPIKEVKEQIIREFVEK